MGGYNSVCEALVQGRPLVIVPRATSRKVEQQIRAELLTARGLARWIHPNELNHENLAEALAWALRCDLKDHALRVREVIPSFDGAARLTTYLSQWLGAAATPSAGPGVIAAAAPPDARRSVMSV